MYFNIQPHLKLFSLLIIDDQSKNLDRFLNI